MDVKFKGEMVKFANNLELNLPHNRIKLGVVKLSEFVWANAVSDYETPSLKTLNKNNLFFVA
jgi:hypothetical protein